MLLWYQKWKDFKKDLKAKNPWLHFALDWTETIIVALALALIIRTWVMQTSVVISGSMIPTLGIDDRIFVNKFIYKQPNRGDIILFIAPPDPTKEFVKRLVGLPGETVEVKDGNAYINGKKVDPLSPYVKNDHSNYGPVTIPKDHYFFMGDNRGNSADSRYWGFVPRENFIGQAFFTYWPIQSIHILN